MQRRRCACDKRFGSASSSTTMRCTNYHKFRNDKWILYEELLFRGFVVSLCFDSDDVSMLQLSGGESTIGASASGGGAIL